MFECDDWSIDLFMENLCNVVWNYVNRTRQDNRGRIK